MFILENFKKKSLLNPLKIKAFAVKHHIEAP